MNAITEEEKQAIHEDDDIVRSEEGLIFNPYNPLNVEITLADVQNMLAMYNVPPIVHNFHLYRRAFVHRSYTKRPDYENVLQNVTIVEKPEGCLPLHTKSNERLEFLGDGVLELVTKYYLYRRFPKENEGFMTEKKIAIVKNEAIGKIALEMGLHKWFVLSKHAEEKKIRTHLKKLGCLFESFIGALFLDFNKVQLRDEEGWFQNTFVTGPGFQMAQTFIEAIFDKHIDWISLIQNDDNYKNILQVRVQKEFKVTPHYLEIGYDADLGYKMGVYLCLGQAIHQVRPENATRIQGEQNIFANIQKKLVDDPDARIFLLLGYGQHKIKRKAEQEACFEAIKALDG